MSNFLDNNGLLYFWQSIKSKFLRGNAGGVFYGTCSTVAGTVAKVVECADFTADNLKAGTIIIVTFTATNSGAVANLTMNVNGTGAKHIKYINNGTLGNLPSAGYLKANAEYPFYYDGDNWVCWFNVNTTYSALNEADMKAGTATTGRLITAARLKQAVEYFAGKLVSAAINALIARNSSPGYVLTYDATMSDSKPYPWSWAPAPGGTTLLPISSDDAAGIYYVISQLKAAADNSGVASMSVPFDAGSAFLSNIYGIYQDNKTPIFVVRGASPNPIMRYLAINNLWAESLETGVSGAEMGYWDGMYHIEFEIGTSTLTIIVEKKG